MFGIVFILFSFKIMYTNITLFYFTVKYAMDIGGVKLQKSIQNSMNNLKKKNCIILYKT